jgi:hypothetical protein
MSFTNLEIKKAENNQPFFMRCVRIWDLAPIV